MRILIMVLSSMMEPYRQFMEVQRETWNSIEESGVDTLYYSGGNIEDASILYETKGGTKTVDLRLKIRDDYYYMAGKFRDALRYVTLSDYDFIFRTNSSSYVNKRNLVEFAKKLPKEKLYAGWEIHGNAGYNIVSGAGIWLSSDVAKILVEKIDPNFEREEDVYIGQLLHEAGIGIINDQSRVDFPLLYNGEALKRAYHIRFKTGDRLNDIKNMKFVHKLINK